MFSRNISFLLALLTSLGIVACGSSEASSPPPVDKSAPAEVAVGEVETLTIEPVGNEMKFATTEFTVAPGQEVRIVFNNTATSAAMQHNVVVLDSREAINRVGQAAISAGPAKEYVPEDAAVLAYTPMAQPGEQVEVTFTAPSEPGEYPYVCTFPGHYIMMQGTMRVAR